MSNFVKQAIESTPMTIYGDGSQTRSFQYVSDLVEGLVKLMDGEHSGPINLGNPGEFTIRELAEMVVDIVGGGSSIVQARPLPQDDPLQRKPDITLAREKLGWTPSTSLEEMVNEMIDHDQEEAHKEAYLKRKGFQVVGPRE